MMKAVDLISPSHICTSVLLVNVNKDRTENENGLDDLMLIGANLIQPHWAPRGKATRGNSCACRNPTSARVIVVCALDRYVFPIQGDPTLD